MHEQIVTTIVRGDESKTLASVKPFYCTCTHYYFSLAME